LKLYETQKVSKKRDRLKDKRFCSQSIVKPDPEYGRDTCSFRLVLSVPSGRDNDPDCENERTVSDARCTVQLIRVKKERTHCSRIAHPPTPTSAVYDEVLSARGKYRRASRTS
jgi:hypothetical protein